MMKVLISDSVSPRAAEIFQKTPEISVDVRTHMSPKELQTAIMEYDGLVVRSATKVTADVLSRAVKMKVIGRAGAGVDNIDVGAATKRGILVMNTPGGNTTAAGEHAIAMMLALCRKIPQATASMKSGKWEKSRFVGVEVGDKILGVIGLGKIGTLVADRALGLRMKVLGYDPLITNEIASQLGIELVSLDDLFSRSDVITVHTPLNSETRNLLNASAFAKMKAGVMVINCARGGIVNEKDLFAALEQGKVSGAALDVFAEEPPKDSPLLAMDQVILTPHLGASTEEAQESVALLIAEQMVDFLINGTIRNAVNFPSVSPEVLATIRPYLDLAERLGSFQAYLAPPGIREVAIEYCGQVAEINVAPVTLALLKGLLARQVGEEVNYVNALLIAKERGIRVMENKTSTAENFTSLIRLKVKTLKAESQVAGTIFGKKDPRIVQVNQFFIEAIPEGPMLLLHALDQPGVIGNIGVTLGKNGVNIGRMQFGRELKEGRALVLLNTDSQVSNEVLEKLHALPNIISVCQLII